MPVFDYVAVDAGGKRARGTIDAENARAARSRLRTQGLFPTSLEEASEQRKKASRDVKQLFGGNRVSTKALSIATRQLATLVSAGLPLVSALQALTDQTDAPVFKRIIVEVREQVEEGSSLADAIGKYPKAFPKLYVNMIASGEASGTLDSVLTNLAGYLEGQVELRRKIWSALTYPILMLFICTLVVAGLLMFVVPRIVEIFEKQGAALPLPTRIMIGVSNFLVHYWYLLILFVMLCVYTMRWYYRQPHGRSKIDRLMLRVPIFSGIYIKIATARVASTLSTLLSSGVGLLTGIEIVRNIVANVHVAKALDEAREGVREGRSLARELGKSRIFPVMLSHMIAVGEKSGELESMLGKAGKSYENEVNATLSGLTALLEPLLMIVVGAIVLFIVMSVLMPMTDLISVIQR